MAKRFAKRARMNRILEAYEGDNEFSRSRLIDEDASMQMELKSIKVNLVPSISSFSCLGCTLFFAYLIHFCCAQTTQNKRRRSLYSSSNSNHDIGLFKRQKSDSNIMDQPVKPGSKAPSTFTSHEGNLSLALMASRSVCRKRKTTFLSGKQSTSFSRQNSCSSKSISLSHVVFVESQSASQFDSANVSNLGKGAVKKSALKSAPKHTASGSLWSKVCSRNWSKE